MSANGFDTAARFKDRFWLFLIVALTLPLAFVPMAASTLSFSFYLMLWITMASSMNIMAGFTGYMPFGYVAFYGIGAFTTAVLTAKFGVPVMGAVLVSGLVGVVTSLLFAPTLRLQGVYFAMVSLALAMICKLSVSSLPEDIFGGSFGIVLARSNDPELAYFTMLATMVAVLLTVWLVTKSRLGTALKAIRDDSEAAAVMGVDVPRTRMKAWALAGLFPSVAGGIEAWYTNIVDPEAAFNVLVTAKSLIFAMAGGLGTITGPVVGSLLMVWLDDIIWQRFPLLNLFLLGLAIVLLMVFLPRGVVGTLIYFKPRLRRFIP